VLVGHWAILRSAIPKNISLNKTIALVHALAKLHNFCIDKQDEMQSRSSESAGIPEPLQQDEDYMIEDLQFPEGRQTALTVSRTRQHH
jgi:hypothetical protein